LSRELQEGVDNQDTHASSRTGRVQSGLASEEDPSETTEFISEPGPIAKRVLQLLTKAGSRLDGVGDSEAPILIVNAEQYLDALAALADPSREGGIVIPRYITDITAENIDACKKLGEELHMSLRHLDGIKSNILISERDFVVDLSLPHSTLPPTRLLYSDSRELLEQQAQLFETLWAKAIPAGQRIREIEEDKPRYETRISRDPYDILGETNKMVRDSNRYAVSSVSGGLLYAGKHSLEQFELVLERARKGRHGGVRWLTRIDRDCIDVASRFLELGMSIRHVDRVPTESFGFSDKEVGVTVSKLEAGSLSTSALFSNDPMYVEHYASVFEEMWTTGTDAQEKIREIEAGIEEPKMTILRNPKQTESIYLELTNSAKHEILLILPTANAYQREVRMGVVQALKMAASERGVSVSMLVPGSAARDDVQRFNQEQEKEVPPPRNPIQLKNIPEAKGQNTVTVLVADRTSSLIVELQDDSQHEFSQAIGVATYSTRSSTVKANVRFFERMWEEESILERERRSRREAELLQDILAHDMRNYNQITKISAELLLDADGSKLSPAEKEALLNNILKAVDRSSVLIERAKKLGRIVSQDHFELRPVNLQDTLMKSMEVITKAHPDRPIEPVYSVQNEAQVLADGFLEDVFTNLLSNSVKYTENDSIRLEIKVEEEPAGDGEEAAAAEHAEGGRSHRYWKITFTDEGRGISDDLKTRVFTRYLDSAHGSGLGLSIVYALVVERYSGKIRVCDRVKGDHTKGTVMEVRLPAA
jgi:two-component system, OmpR family, sensor histidine kinase VicK